MARPDDELIEEIEREPTADSHESTTSVAAESNGRLGEVFSLKAFLLTAVLIAVGVGVGGLIPLVGTVGSLVGLLLATFLTGLVASQRRYLETALAGGGIVGLSFAVSLLTTGVLPVGMQFFREYGLLFGGAGVALGAGLGVVGHYLGRDLRDGLTQEI